MNKRRLFEANFFPEQQKMAKIEHVQTFGWMDVCMCVCTTSASNASHRGSQSSDMNTECSTNTATTNNDGNKQFAQRWMKSKSSLSTSTVMDGTVGEWDRSLNLPVLRVEFYRFDCLGD